MKGELPPQNKPTRATEQGREGGQKSSNGTRSRTATAHEILNSTACCKTCGNKLKEKFMRKLWKALFQNCKGFLKFCVWKDKVIVTSGEIAQDNHTLSSSHQQHYNCTQRLPSNYQLPNRTPPTRVAQTPFGSRTTSSASEVFARLTANARTPKALVHSFQGRVPSTALPSSKAK